MFGLFLVFLDEGRTLVGVEMGMGMGLGCGVDMWGDVWSLLRVVCFWFLECLGGCELVCLCCCWFCFCPCNRLWVPIHLLPLGGGEMRT